MHEHRITHIDIVCGVQQTQQQDNLFYISILHTHTPISSSSLTLVIEYGERESVAYSVNFNVIGKLVSINRKKRKCLRHMC